MVRRKMSLFHRMLLISGIATIVALVAMVGFSPDLSAKSTSQVHQQQEAMMQFYEESLLEKPSIIVPSGPDTVIIKGESIEAEDTFQKEVVIIIPSAANAINVSVDVFDNLSLSIVDGQPEYATNWFFGATLHMEEVSRTELAYTVTADY